MTKAATGLCMGCMSPIGDYIVCPHCNYDNSSPSDNNYRRPGSVLGNRYIIGRLLKKNGESGQYIGYDNSLKCRVWIREYFPYTIAVRDPATGNVLPKEGLDAQYKALFSDFVDVCNEVKRLSVTDPVIPIENMVSENGTVYAIYKDMGVISFETFLAQNGGKLPVSEAVELLSPLYGTLGNLHGRGEIHRGVSPYTVYVDQDRTLYLGDFCMSAARTGDSELESELFNGYSAPEQYASNGWQGTWTDVYGAAALFYRTVSGFVPPKSTMINDERPLTPLSDLVLDIPASISDAVDEAMRTTAQLRTPEVYLFAASLQSTTGFLSEDPIFDTGKVERSQEESGQEEKRSRAPKRNARKEKKRGGKYVFLGLLCTVIALGLVMWIIMSTYFPELITPDWDDSQVSQSDMAAVTGDQDDDSPSEEEASDRTVPSFIGQTASEVTNNQEYLERFSFSIESDYNDQYAEGEVYNQSPEPGVLMANRGTVILHVSKGTRMVKMPDLTGMLVEEAGEELKKLVNNESDVTFDVYERYEQGADPGTIVGTSPAVDTEFNPKETAIYLFVMPGDPEESSDSADGDGQSTDGANDGIPQYGGPIPDDTPPDDGDAPTERDGSSRITVEDFMRQRYTDQD